MSNLIKISNVTFYFGENNFDEQVQCKNFLEQNGIYYLPQLILSKSYNETFLAGMNLTVFGPNFTQYTFTGYPIITWYEHYDDYERFMEVAKNLTELTTSNLIVNKSLIV